MSREWFEDFFDGVVVDMWRAATPELLREKDRAMDELLSDPRLRLPAVLPDGTYRK